MNVSEMLKQFLDFEKNCETIYELYSENVPKCDKATQDLLHQLEFGSYKERQKTATMIANIRKERRESKDGVAILQPLMELVKTNEGKKFIRQLQLVLRETRRVEKNMLNRIYTPRILTSIEIAKKIKPLEESIASPDN